MPISPPLLPTNTLSSTTSGAIVMVSPFLILPISVANLLAGLGIDRDGVVIERIEEEPAVGEDTAAIDASQQATPCERRADAAHSSI